MSYTSALTFVTSGYCGTFVRGARAIGEGIEVRGYRTARNHPINHRMKQVLTVAAVADGVFCAVELAGKTVPAAAKLTLLGLRAALFATALCYDSRGRQTGDHIFKTGGRQLLLVIGALAEGTFTKVGYAKTGRVCNLAVGLLDLSLRAVAP